MKALLFVLLVSLLADPGAGVKHGPEKCAQEDGLKDLPLIEVPGKDAARHCIFAVIVSGDGGWAKID